MMPASVEPGIRPVGAQKLLGALSQKNLLPRHERHHSTNSVVEPQVRAARIDGDTKRHRRAGTLAGRGTRAVAALIGRGAKSQTEGENSDSNGLDAAFEAVLVSVY